MKQLQYKDKEGQWQNIGSININDGSGSSGGGDVYVLPEEIDLRDATTVDVFEGTIDIDKANEIIQSAVNGKILASKTKKEHLTIGEGGYCFCTQVIYANESGIEGHFYDDEGYYILCVTPDGEVSIEYNFFNSSYSLLTSPLARTSLPTIQAGKQYFNEQEDLTIDNFEGFSARNKTATILSSKPITFKGDNVLTPSAIPESDYLLYTITYMQTSEIKYVLVVSVTAMDAPQGGLKGEDVVPVASQLRLGNIKSSKK